jgi:hypothetical protein
MFEHTSRYYHLETRVYEAPDGRVIAYKRRRFSPQGESLPTLAEVRVHIGDRLDLISARTLGDPEQFWQICDANNALNPFGLTDEIGRVVRVPVPQFQE